MEFVFMIREVISRDPQELVFNIVDLKGSPLSRVVVSERVGDKTACCGIFVQTLTRMQLAMVDTSQVHAQMGMPAICRPSGELFGFLQQQESGDYSLRTKHGQDILTFHGDFGNKTLNATSACGETVCVTE